MTPRNLIVLLSTILAVALAAKWAISKREIPPPEAFHIEPMQAAAPRRAPVTRPVPLAAALVDVAPAAVSLPAPPLPAPASEVISSGEVDAGPTQAQLEVAQLRDQVQALKNRSAQLEQQLQQLQSQGKSDPQAVQELQGLRQQIAAEAQERQAAKAQAAQQKQNVDAAISALVAADQRLATGDTDIDAAIAQADQAFSSHARWNLAALRHAIENKDLANARLYLQQAIADAQLAR